MSIDGEPQGIPKDADPITARCIREVITPSETVWDSLKDAIYPIELHHFKDTEPFSPEDFQEDFANPDATIIITRDPDTNNVVGLTYAEPTPYAYNKFYTERVAAPKTAYIFDTILHPDYIGHHLVGPMIQSLEAELVRKGYEYLERDAAVNNSYAANIKKNYGDRIIKEESHESVWGQQVFYRIKLATPSTTDHE